MSRDPIALGPGREFDLVRALVRAWGRDARGIGDDAALLDVPSGQHLVASVDASVEGVHFRRDWLTPREIGYRATAAALSDLAAMAATPLGMLVALTLPASWRDDALAIGEGVGECARAFNAPIVGGDTIAGRELALAITVLGVVSHPLTRDGARPGDGVYVTGRLGAPRAAVEALARGESPSAAYRDRFACPAPRIMEARWLASHGATSAIDVSDGLVADLGHLAAASDVRIELDLERVPRVNGVEARAAATGGEEYELAFTSSVAIDADAFVRAFGVPLTRIGVVRKRGDAESRVGVIEDGKFVDLAPGYDHLSS